MSALTVTIGVEGARVGAVSATIKLTPAQRQAGALLVWLGGEAVLVPLVRVKVSAKRRGPQHARKARRV